MFASKSGTPGQVSLHGHTPRLLLTTHQANQVPGMKAAEGFAEQQTQTHHGEDNAGAEHYPNISLYTVPHRAGESEHTHHAEGEEQLESDHAEHLSGRRQSTHVFHSDTTQFTSRMG